MKEITKIEFAIDEMGRVSVNDEIDFTLDTYLDMLESVSENSEIYSNLTAAKREYINSQFWEELQIVTTIEELWEERDWFETMAAEK